MSQKAQETERTKELRKKLLPFADHVRIKWEDLDSWSDREIEMAKLVLLRKIDAQTNRAAKNTAFMTWMIIVMFVISIIILLEM